MKAPRFETYHFEPSPEPQTFSTENVSSAVNEALYGQGVALISPLGIDTDTRLQMHQASTTGEPAVGNGELTQDILYYNDFEPEIFTELFEKLFCSSPPAFTEPMLAVNLQYMVYPPGSSLAEHFDFVDATTPMQDSSDPEALTVIYIVAGHKRLGVQLPTQNPTEKIAREIHQGPDMLVLLRGAAIHDGQSVLQAIAHHVPKLTTDEISASITFDIMPIATLAKE